MSSMYGLKQGSIHTRAWGSLTYDIQIMQFVEELKAIQVHFTLDSWEHEGPMKFEWMENLHDILRGPSG